MARLDGVSAVATANHVVVGDSGNAMPWIAPMGGGERCRSGRVGLGLLSISHAMLGLAIGQLVSSFQRRARGSMCRGAGGQHSTKR